MPGVLLLNFVAMVKSHTAFFLLFRCYGYFNFFYSQSSFFVIEVSTGEIAYASKVSLRSKVLMAAVKLGIIFLCLSL